jgi:DNA-directed RNA polymerase subunit M/transcription elongation factor TFIIS
MHEIPTALSLLQTVTTLTKTIIDSKISSALREQAIESQSAIIQLQTAMMNMHAQYQTLLQEKNELKQQLIDIEDWNTEARKYSLEDIESGIFVYVLKPEEEATTPAHWLCPRCYYEKYKSILQRTGADSNGIIFYCQKCGNTLRMHTTPGKDRDA